MRCPAWSNYKDVGGSPLGSYEFRGWAKLGGNSSSKLVKMGREWLTTAEVKIPYKPEAA